MLMSQRGLHRGLETSRSTKVTQLGEMTYGVDGHVLGLLLPLASMDEQSW